VTEPGNGLASPTTQVSHLIDIEGLGTEGLQQMLSLTDHFVEVTKRKIPKVPALRGRTVVWLFYEDSTRTRLSFESAARRLSADTLNFSVSSSSVNKGESLHDTVSTICAMGVDCIVVRHRSSGAPARIADWVDPLGISVVNAGDGWHQHPTQALLDCYTLRSKLGSLEGRRIGIIGDVKHSRVARSQVDAYRLLGAEVVLVAPPTLLPPAVETWGVELADSLDDVLGELDVVGLLRMQNERMDDALVPSIADYTATYGLTVERAACLAPGAVITHPGPINRGVEIAPEVADDPRCLALSQVANGVPVRMAVLYRLLGSGLDFPVDR